MTVHVYYHRSDFDGQCSGAIARYFYEGGGDKVEMHAVDYADDLVVPIPCEGELVVCVDFSFEEALTRLLVETGRFVWIDHHKTAIERIEKAEPPLPDIKGVRKEGTAACELCWGWFYPAKILPTYIWMLGRYDVWDQSDMDSWESEMLPLQHGMRQTSWQPKEFDDYAKWKALFSLPEIDASLVMHKFVVEGRCILRYVRQQDAVAAKAGCYEATILGRPVIVINKVVGKEFFKTVSDPAKHDFTASWVFTGTKFRVTLTSVKPDFDVSKIAKKFGGGGHKGAAGFEWTGDIREAIVPKVEAK